MFVLRNSQKTQITVQATTLMTFVLQTPLLNLVPVEKADLKDIHELHLLPETNAFNTLGIPKDLAQTQDILGNWINRPKNKEAPGYIFSLRQKPNNEFIGLIAINTMDKNKNQAEVWYKIHPKFWNKGYATSGLQAIIEFGFDTLKLESVLAGCAVDNTASIRVLEKAGMIRETITRKSMLLNTGWSDRLEYIISVDETKS